MNIDVVVDEKRYNYLQKYGMSGQVGYWLWNLAIQPIPYDTGNAKSSCYLGRAKKYHIRIVYDLHKANYIKFLEEGMGPVKKYKGFIKHDTMALLNEQLIVWIVTGKMAGLNIRNPRPIVHLRESKHKPFSQERMFLLQANANASVITPKQRQKISMIRSTAFGKTNSPTSKAKPMTSRNPRSSGLSVLNAIYKERKDFMLNIKQNFK